MISFFFPVFGSPKKLQSLKYSNVTLLRVTLRTVVIVVRFLSRTQLEHLRRFAPIAINGYALQPKLPCFPIDLGNILRFGVMGHINRFGDRVVNTALECSLNLKMPLRRDLQGCYKELF